MKSIAIKFSGMGGNFDPNNNFIINILRKHFDVKLSDKPDFLIYSVNSRDYLKYECVRIFYTSENLTPDFNICDYAIGFHNIEFEDRYIRYPVYMVDSFNAYAGDDYGHDLYLAEHKHENVERKLDSKEEFCSFVYSNADGAECRTKLFEELEKYKKVNSGGRYLNNIGGPIDNKLSFQSKHKFVIAFENTSSPGYTTEKIVHAFAAGAIPIYWGNPLIDKEFNTNSFINCHEFGLTSVGDAAVIQQIIRRVTEIDGNDNLYKEMLSIPAFVNQSYVDEMNRRFECFLYKIFSQTKDEAYRRNRYYWGERYERKQKIGNDFYWICRKVIPIRDFLLKVIRKYKGAFK